MRRNSDFIVLRTSTAMAPGISPSVGPRPYQYKGQEVAMTAGIFLGLGLLEGLQDFIADRDSVRQIFQPRRKPLKFVVSKITVSYSGCQDQKVVTERYSCA